MLSFGGDLNLTAGPSMSLLAGDGETISIDGALSLVADNEIVLAADGGSISADLLVARAAGGDYGAYILLEAESGWEGNPGSLSFGQVSAFAGSGDGPGGNIGIIAGPGSSINLGQTLLSATGSGAGDIILSAGNCDCGGEGEQFALQAESLGESGGISADSLLLLASGDINMFVAGGADIGVAGTMQGYAGQTAWLYSDGSTHAVRAHEIGLNAITILDGAPVIADIVRFSAAVI